jgi:NAD(P)-dependent dehydrogenase (short-subunit alcohol dehydrogenase family)
VVEANRAKGGEAIAIPCDITQKNQLAALVEQTRAHWGGIDILVCNAATAAYLHGYMGPSAGIPDEAYDQVMNTNVRSNFWLCNMTIPIMVERGGGSIIVISSIAGLRGAPGLPAYSLSKAADMQLVRNIAVEWGPKNIRANCIAPGLIRTDFARPLWDNPEFAESWILGTPLRRIGEPGEIAGAAVFLAAPAGSFMTGQTIVIDGGVMTR